MIFLGYVLAFLATLAIVVVFHEFGHYAVARCTRVRILVFSVGFGKHLWSFVDRHGTRFALSTIPLGGYVQMLQSDAEAKEHGIRIGPNDAAFPDLPLWQRTLIVLAGPFANIVLAAVIYWTLAVFGVTSAIPMTGAVIPGSPAALAGLEDHREIVAIDDRSVKTWSDVMFAISARLGDSGTILVSHRTLGADTEDVTAVPIAAWLRDDPNIDALSSFGLSPKLWAVVGATEPGGAAARSGLRRGDRITHIDGEAVSIWVDLVVATRAIPPGTSSTWGIIRDETDLDLAIAPGRTPEGRGPREAGYVGISPALTTTHLGPVDALAYGLYTASEKTVLLMGHVKKVLFGDVSPRNVIGAGGIAKASGDAMQAGWRAYFRLLAILSISIGIFNLLPIPPLDGGLLVYFAAEGVLRKPLPDAIANTINRTGFAVILTVGLLALVNDIPRLL